MPKIAKTKKGQHFQMVLPRPVLELYRFAREDATTDARPELNAIAVEIELSGKGRAMTRVGHAVGCDGHRLCHYWWPVDQPVKDLPKAPFYLDPEACKAFVRGIKRPKGEPAPVFRAVSNGEGIELDADMDEYIDATHNDSYREKFPEKKYPEWRKVMPKRNRQKEKLVSLTFRVNGDYLHDFTRYLHVLDVGPFLEFHYEGHNEICPMLIIPTMTHNAGSFDGYPGFVEYVLMPVR